MRAVGRTEDRLKVNPNRAKGTHLRAYRPQVSRIGRQPVIRMTVGTAPDLRKGRAQ